MTATLDIKAGPLFKRTAQSKAQIIVHEGGTSSGKTVALLQRHLAESFRVKGSLITVARSTVPNLKRGPIRDWRNVLSWANCTNLFEENKTDHIWTNLETGSQIEFVAVDDEQKARGPRRTDLHVNEANEIPHATYTQLALRTKGRIFIDYNPSLMHWWIDTEVLSRDDVDVFYSTYKDNPFLTKKEREGIESLVPVYQELDNKIVDWTLSYDGEGTLISGDAFRWGVFGLGRRGSPAEAIYPYTEISPFPSGEYIRGLDFGFEHPSVLMDVARVDCAPRPRAHFRQQIFARGMDTSDLIRRMDDLGLDKQILIIADNSRPESIKQIADAGYNIIPTKKGPGSVKEGIDYVKQHDLHFAPGSDESRTQFQNYRRRTVAGIITDEPIKADDDAPDAGRYGLFEYWGVGQETWGMW